MSGEVAGWMDGCVINGRMDGLDGRIVESMSD